MSSRQLCFPLTRGHDEKPDPQLVLTVLRSGPLTELDVAGVLDLATAGLVTATAEHVIAGYGPRWLVLQLARVQLLAAAGIDALLHVRQAVTAQRGQLILRDPSATARKILGISGSESLFRIVTSADHPAGLPTGGG